MKLLVIGGDARCAHLAELARRAGLDACAAGHSERLSRAREATPSDASDADAVVLPDVRILDDAPYAAYGARLRPEARLFTYANPLIPCEMCACGRRIANLLRDEKYLLENAALTAEGAIVKCARGDRAFLDARVFVVGAGRIAAALCARLTAMRARVTAFARRKEALAALDARGDSLSGLAARMGEAEFLFNTVPARVIDPAMLRAASPGACLVDLASAPYGFDLDEARALGLCAARESGLPGRYGAQKAGGIMLEAVLRLLNDETGKEGM